MLARLEKDKLTNLKVHILLITVIVKDMVAILKSILDEFHRRFKLVVQPIKAMVILFGFHHTNCQTFLAVQDKDRCYPFTF
jgi:hypothetical protein